MGKTNHAGCSEEMGREDFDKINTDEEARSSKKHNLENAETMTRGLVISTLFEEYCEKHLEGPLFIIGHPVEISPLSKRDPKDPRITRRFEAYINTWEIANAFSELNDPIDQYQRFKAQQEQLEKGDNEAHPMDEDFVNALEVGMPPTGGLGIGIDRVIMLLTNAALLGILYYSHETALGLSNLSTALSLVSRNRFSRTGCNVPMRFIPLF